MAFSRQNFCTPDYSLKKKKKNHNLRFYSASQNAIELSVQRSTLAGSDSATCAAVLVILDCDLIVTSSARPLPYFGLLSSRACNDTDPVFVGRVACTIQHKRQDGQEGQGREERREAQEGACQARHRLHQGST